MEWLEPQKNPPFPMLQVSSAPEVAQFSILVPLLVPGNGDRHFSVEIWAESENSLINIFTI